MTKRLLVSVILFMSLSLSLLFDKRFVKQTLILKGDMNKEEAVILSKEHLAEEGANLTIVAIYLCKEQFEYSYIVTIAKVKQLRLEIYNITIHCSKQSYWSASIINAIKENMINLSFHKPKYVNIQKLIDHNYKEKGLHLKFISSILYSDNIFVVKPVLRESNIKDILIIEENYDNGELSLMALS